jgi:phytoene dehydrogenase-like protein
VDPTRAPEGTHILWVQVRALPARIRGDAAGEITADTWEAVAEPYADRVMAKLERYAPGLAGIVRERAILTPADLERHDPNLVGGDSISGSHHLRQNFLLRPLPGLSRYATPFAGLFMTGAATWPGGGVTGIPGMLAAQRVLEGDPLARRVGRRVVALATRTPSRHG